MFARSLQALYKLRPIKDRKLQKNRIVANENRNSTGHYFYFVVTRFIGFDNDFANSYESTYGNPRK